MSFVFYDTETTGISTDFDQILQFAAIRTDANLNEVERIEMRCRLLPQVVPHPAALKVTGMSIAKITRPNLPSHYEMIRAINAKLTEWSPAIFVGYNSMSFDEKLLRQALFRTLHAPYLTNTNGNCRADAMSLVQVASEFAPDCLIVPTGSNGKPIFKLDQVSPANGFAHQNAHDALSDVEATIHLAKCVRDRAPECWHRFVEFSSKASVTGFIKSRNAFVLTEFYFNKPYHYVVAPIGADPANPAVQLCIDLRNDLGSISSLCDSALSAWVARSPKPIRRVKTNAAPSIAPKDGVPQSWLGGLTASQIDAASLRIREDAGLRNRLIAAVMAERSEFESSPHVEEQIYSGFIPTGDRRKMEAFHLVPWRDRIPIIASFEDSRLRYYGFRLVYEHQPELLTPEIRDFYRTHDSNRLMDTTGTAKWNTLAGSLAAIDELIPSCNDVQFSILNEYRGYLQTRIAAGG